MANRRSHRRDHAQRTARWLAFVVVFGPVSWSLASPSNPLTTATRRLGSEAFTERHAAGDTLLKAGASAIPYLREAATSDSPEVRFRASELLRRIELQILDSQKAEILSGSLGDGFLPAWDRYRELVSASEPARRLFVAMLEKSPHLMLSIGTPEFAEAFDRRMNEWTSASSPWQRSRGPDASEELAALLLAACQPECTPTQAQAQMLSRSAEFGWFGTQMASTDRSQPLKALVTGWVTQSGRGSAESRLHLAQHYQLREGVEPAREIIAQDATGLEVQNAILFLASFGEDADVPRLEQLLNNDAELQTFQSKQPADAMKTQVRDVALVGLWKRSGQDPKGHGVTEYAEQNGAPRAGSMGFHDDEQRRVAILRWRTWRKRHLKADLPPDGEAIEGRRA